jgi:hypothetical protein
MGREEESFSLVFLTRPICTKEFFERTSFNEIFATTTGVQCQKVKLSGGSLPHSHI